jgi:two-component system, cell cycle response regulator DivK
MKILIVEDHPDMRELLCLILVSLDHIPVVARHGKEGVAIAVSEKPHLILMDIRMPVMDGWEAVKALRGNPETIEIPILATTAMIRASDLKACLEAGCNGYIVKPFGRLELQTKILELLSDRRVTIP